MHALLAWGYSDRAWVTPLGISLNLSVGMAFAWSRGRAASRAYRVRWYLVAGGFALWIAGYAASSYSQLTGANGSLALPYLLIFALRAIPWFFALVRTSDRTVLPHTRLFDVGQAILFATTATLFYYPQLLGGSDQVSPLTGDRAAHFHDLVNGILALLAWVFMNLQPNEEERRFTRNLAILLVSYALSALVVNHIIIDEIAPPPGSLLFMLGTIPVVLYILASLQGRADTDAQRPLARGTTRRAALLFVPAFMPTACIVMAFALAPRDPGVAAILAALAIALYAGSSVLTQIAQGQSQAEWIRAHDSMARLARIDPLTGLANRRHFTEELHSRWTTCSEAGCYLSALFVDVDHFKQYNDARGHSEGDLCLQRVAHRLAGCEVPREKDLVARYGGEEFVLLLSNLSPQETARVAERIREWVFDANFEHPQSPLGRISVSVGAASTLPTRAANDVTALISEADAALYMAKSRGRNCSVGPY
ncbi:GGDEF domain-containing protein [Dokdonella sp. MW10]|uniref:GGDEF domain-containing protein n=1 Tax=Dokdonella sp. MW10 TaxID=2992926 RepID=UPI003F7FC1D8